MRALRRFTVRSELPEALAGLETLAMNLRWTWHPPTQDLFADVDRQAWDEVGGDPLRLLAKVPAGRLHDLAADESFRARAAALNEDLRHYLSEPRWYQQRELRHGKAPTSVAYFSMEFGVTEALPNYSGGLGILAGDHLKAASDLGVPLIGVGLLYRSGYFRQSLSANGWQREHYPHTDPAGLPLRALTEVDGHSPVEVKVAMPGGEPLRARVWLAEVGRVPLLLLDSDVASNPEHMRRATDRLYGGNQEQRIGQEILAGIGGVRAVRRYCELAGREQPEVFHTNEGHAGFLGLERIRELCVERGLSFEAATVAVRAGTVFTTHTPVPAGIDRFPKELLRRFFDSDPGAEQLLPGIDAERVLEMGEESDPRLFNMAHMGLRLAQRANGVSELHGKVSRKLFQDLWPGTDAEEVPIGAVTNGVHGPTWAAREINKLLGESELDSGVGLRGFQPATDSLLWELRCTLRSRLVHEVRRRLRRSWLERGASELELGWVDRVFDPDVLTVGFARRVPTYKRLTLMLREPERLRALLLDDQRPVQLVVAGKSHPADEGGKGLIQRIVQFADQHDVRHRIAFLPDYDMSMARYLYWGSDLWLNNPLRPLEACGTSGMKSALNGGLNISVRDGWWDEMHESAFGWVIPTAAEVDGADRRDDLEAGALYELLERQVVPLFYERSPEGVPVRWMAKVRQTLTRLGPQVQASRMVREYVESYYDPASSSVRGLARNGYAGANDLAEYRTRLGACWQRVRIEDCELDLGTVELATVGQWATATAAVTLGGLAASEIRVQCVLGWVDDDGELSEPSTTDLLPEDSEPTSGPVRYGAQVRLPVTGQVGFTVRVLPAHGLLACPVELGRVVVAG